MNRIVVIADDITGAAEIAGIAHRYGLKTTLSISPFSPQGGTEGGAEGFDVHVIATDARSYGPEEAARMTKEALMCLTVPPSDYIFHKVDSALRGNVQSQIDAILSTLTTGEGLRGALYMPANPSKGRIIKDGTYYISSTQGGTEGFDFIPLHKTNFSFDPEFPAWSSRLDERFPGLEYANAETKADVDRVVERALAEGKLLAGAADLFCSFIEHVYHLTPTPPQPFGGLPEDALKLIVQGSTQSKSYDLGVRIETMPLDVFYEKAKPVTWAATILNRAEVVPTGIALTIGDKEVRPGKAAAVYLRNAMAEVCCTVLEARHPDELIIEGGATAFAIMSQLPYTTFRITDEIAPGVVRIAPTDHPSLHITLKPGSYNWGGLFSPLTPQRGNLK